MGDSRMGVFGIEVSKEMPSDVEKEVSNHNGNNAGKKDNDSAKQAISEMLLNKKQEVNSSFEKKTPTKPIFSSQADHPLFKKLNSANKNNKERQVQGKVFGDQTKLNNLDLNLIKGVNDQVINLGGDEGLGVKPDIPDNVSRYLQIIIIK